jgi:alkanesulfonate monooxygenase SsuD/methylene tetrahydromethanopterin reductase-like flavin-dependent oxidoreductase (luciferase family)
VKVMFVVSPVIGSTMREARERRAAEDARVQYNAEVQLVHMGGVMEIDMSVFNLDEPLPEDITTNGHQSTLQSFLNANRGKTLREAVSQWRIVESVELVGTPDSIAAEMGEVMQEVGGDGYLISRTPQTRQYVNEICDGLAPALRQRGLIRDGYQHQLFRDNLMAF